MPNRISTILLLAMLFVVRPGAAPAAPLGSGFTYQGQLQQAGVPVDGAVSLRFSLWDAAGSGEPPMGGNMIGGMQVVANAPVTGGVFSVTLNGSGEFGPAAFNGEARWLQVEVCTDSTCGSTTVLGPRQPVTGAPYALGPWQLTGADLSYSQGNVGIGTTSPAHTLHLKDTMPAVILEDSAIPSQQSGYIAFWNGTSETGWMGYGTAGSPDMTLANARPSGDIVLWAAGERLRVDSGGNVGIGTSTPASRLEVRGDVRLGSVGELFATSSSENLRIVRGKVSSTGVTLLGSGFTSTRTGTGAYTITFNTGFPAVGGTPDITVSAESSSTFVVAMVSLASPSVCTVRTVNASNAAVDATFHFVAAGPR
jgi:hypothetical protein